MTKNEPGSDNTPTPGAVIADRRVLVDRDVAVNLPNDIGGDRGLYRYTWKVLIEQIDPDIIIYVLDGSKSFQQLEEDVQRAFDDVLVYYQDNLRKLKIFYVLINYWDVWRFDEEKRSVLKPRLELSFRDKAKSFLGMKDERLVWGFYESQLASDGRPWNEIKAALGHLGEDIRQL